MGRLTIAGLIAAVTLGTFVVVASAQPTPPPPSNFWPPLDKTKKAPVAEWYSDIPWNSKAKSTRGEHLVFAVLRLMTRPISTGPPPPASTNASPGTGRRPRSPATRRRPQRNEGAEAPLTTAGCPQLAKADAASAAYPSVNPSKPAWIGPTLFWRPPSVPGSGFASLTGAAARLRSSRSRSHDAGHPGSLTRSVFLQLLINARELPTRS